MRDTGRTPWGVLGVAEGAPFSDVKRAYLRRARITHPDAPGGSAEAFRQVQAAFEALKCAVGGPDAVGQPGREAQSSRPARSSRAARSPGSVGGDGPARSAGTTPYDRWVARPGPFRQWIDDDPLILEHTVSTSRRVTFAEVLAGELSRCLGLHLGGGSGDDPRRLRRMAV